MYNERNLIYILTILEAIEKCFIYTEDIHSSDEFYQANEQLNYNACQLLLMTIGEESKKLEERIKEDFNNIQWRNIANFRNRIAHDYRGVNPKISFSIVKDFLPQLKQELMKILNETDVDREILKIASESEFYKHIGYIFKK